MNRFIIVLVFLAGSLAIPSLAVANTGSAEFRSPVSHACKHASTARSLHRCEKRVQRRERVALRRERRTEQRVNQYIRKYGPEYAHCAVKKIPQNREYCRIMVRERKKTQDPSAYALLTGYWGGRWACNRDVVVAVGTAPAWHRPFIVRAVARLRAASGLRLVTTPGDSGDIVIRYDPDAVYEAGAIAMAGSHDEDGDGFFDWGELQLGKQTRTKDPADPTMMNRVYLHELGHTLGLDHVNNDYQVMGTGAAVENLGGGDKAGLRKVGCHR